MPYKLEKPFVLWFTGLPCSGKTTIANALSTQLKEHIPCIEYLDGDVVRNFISNAGFSKSARDAHIRQMGFLASRLENHGVGVVTSFVSPYKGTRNEVREMCSDFIEVHVSTPLEECERRDVKGMYQKARVGEIQNFTGIQDPYEAPQNPEIEIDTTNRELADCLKEVLAYLLDRGFIVQIG